MKIPIIVADEPQRVYQQPYAGVGARAAASVGEEITGLTADIAKQQSILREKERIANDTLRAIELENQMREATQKIQEGFLKRTDSENFDRDLTSQLAEVKSTLQPANPSNELNISFQRAFNRYASSVSDTVMTQKYRVMEERGRVAIGGMVDNAAEEYARTDDQVKKNIIKKRTELEIRSAIDKNLVNPVWGENQIREFERYAKSKEADVAEAVAINRMSVDPGKLASDLKNPNYLPGLTDQSRRATLAKEAETAARVQQAEAERKRKEIETELHDREEREIGNLYMAGDYTKAYAKAFGSKVLKGDEKATWANAIKNAQKITYDQVDPLVETAEIVKVNDMISNELPLKDVENYIIQSQNLRRENKEQYLTKLESQYSADIKEARSTGLTTIKEQIIPKRGITADLIETPLETAAVAKAQLIFLDWLDEQSKAKKRPNRTEILYKAMSVAAEYQVSIADQINFLQGEATRIQQEAEGARK